MRAGRPADGGRAAVEAVLADADAGDATALAALAEIGQWLGIGLAGLVNMLNPARVVLGGRLAALHPFVAATVEDELDRRALGRAACARGDRPGDARRRRTAARRRRAGVRADPRRSGELVQRPGGARAGRSTGHRPTGGTTTMSKLSRLHRGPRRATGEETRMHARRSAALVMSAALVLVAACGDDDDSGARQRDHGGRGRHAAGDGGDAPRSRRSRHDRPAAAAAAATASSACRGTTTRKSAGRSGTSRRSRRRSRPAAARYVSNDAKSSAETQASNVENLISQGANVLIILAQDGTAIKPSVASATSNGDPGHRLRPPDRGSGGAVRRRSTTSRSDGCRPRRSSRSCPRATT